MTNFMTNKTIVIAGIVLAVVALAAFFFFSTGVCENCGTNTLVHTYQVGAFGFREEATLCHDCAEGLRALGLSVA